VVTVGAGASAERGYPWLGPIPCIADVALGSRRPSGRNAHDAATNTSIDSGAATCHPDRGYRAAVAIYLVIHALARWT
jgi:hypothetical protein